MSTEIGMNKTKDDSTIKDEDKELDDLSPIPLSEGGGLSVGNKLVIITEPKSFYFHFLFLI